jgi:hypothetical protein
MKIGTWCKGLLTIVLLSVLAGCLASDPPKLGATDLATPGGLPGAYFASRFPDSGDGTPQTVDAVITAAPDRSYQLTFLEGEHKDAPVLLRLVTLDDGGLLAVLTDPRPDSDAVYAAVTVAANGAWVFRMIDLAATRRTRAVQEAIMRHGGSGVTYDTGDLQHDQIHGSLTAANLRALFSDPAFVSAIGTTSGFRLSPKP